MTIPFPFTLARNDAAKFYRDHLGWAIHPLYGPHKGPDRLRGKKPELKGWRDWRAEQLTDEMVEKFFGAFGASNLGCVVQAPHVCVDLDSKSDQGASVMAWLSAQPDLAAVPRERTGGGVHLHFICRDLPAFRNKNGDPYDKALAAQISDKVTAELFFQGCNLVISPSQHASGHTYTWEVGGDLPEVTWAQLKEWFVFVEPNASAQGKSVGKIKAPKEKPWWSKFKGDLSTLDLRGLFRERGHLGDCIDPDKHQWGVRCPWCDEHADQGKDWSAGSTDTAIFNPPGRMPGFKCLHAHCDGRDIGALLDRLESDKPGCVDAACKQMRVWQPGQANKDGRPRIVLPGLDRPESVFAAEVGDAIAPIQEWFNKNDNVVVVGSRKLSEDAPILTFRQMLPVMAITSIEEHIETGIIQKEKESDDRVFRVLSMARETAGSLLAAPQFKNRLPQIVRILDLPIPIRRGDGSIEFPKVGYDPRFRTYCDPGSPLIKPMPVSAARQLLLRIHQGFCFRDAQSITHTIARLITPYCRGLMGWPSRFPLWIFTANRPRAGKDYLAGVTSIVYEGAACEDAPLERDSEETRKRITAALAAGRRLMHLANCQGHIDDAVFIGAITSSIFSARNLGSTDSRADLRLPNEIEFSISANVGLTYREDVEPRSRKISLLLEQENPNQRKFAIKLLHAYITRHRSEILSAIASLVGAWIDAGCPEGTTQFSSFPQWASTVGGIMTFHGLGDPCLPNLEDGTEVGGDRGERAMRTLYAMVHEKYPDRWIDKQAIFQLIAQFEDNDDLTFFGSFSDQESRKTKTRIGVLLRKFDRRELNGVRLEIDRSAAKTNSQPVRFIRVGDQTTGAPQAIWQEFGFLPEKTDTSDTFEKAENPKVSDVSGSFSNADGHLGHLGHLSHAHESPEVVTPKKRKKISSRVNNISLSTERAEVAEVSKVSAPPRPYRLIAESQQLCEVASLLGGDSHIALDVETFGFCPGDGLDPWKGEIRLLQLAGEETPIFLLDLQALGYDLGPVAELLSRKHIIAHNARFDARWLQVKCGIRPAGICCTLTAARILCAGTKPGNNLDLCLERYLGITQGDDHSTSDWGAMLLTEQQITYAARDVAFLHLLKAKLEGELEMEGLDAVHAMEKALLPIVIDMEVAGIAVDVPRMRQIEETCRQKAEAAAREVRGLLDSPHLKLNSPKQLLAALNARGIGITSTAEDVLQSCGDKTFVPKILEHRSFEKQAQQAASLLECVASDGRIHGQFDPVGTATGRFSSKRPNMQNIGRGELRQCFIAPEGRSLVIADYSQVELRAAASIAGEVKMVEAYHRGEDLHKMTAASVLGKQVEEVTKDDRQLAKAVNFGLLYGQNAKGLVRYAKTSYGVTISEDEARLIRQKFFATYGSLRQWHGQSHRLAEQGVSEVRTSLGRRRLIESSATEWERFTALVNTPVQGGCADGIKAAMIALPSRLPAKASIISTVHDEIIVECDQSDAAEVSQNLRTAMREEMEGIFPTVPIEVEVGVCSTWGEKP